MADPVTRVVEILVRLVFDPALSPCFEIPAEVAAAHLDQRANDDITARVDSAEAGEPGPPNELEQKGLCLVVASVTDGNPAGGSRLRRSMKEVVPEPARGVLYGQPLCLGVRADVDRLHGDGKAETFRQLTAKLLVAGGGAAKAMVQMGKRYDCEAVLLGKFLKKQGQGD